MVACTTVTAMAVIAADVRISVQPALLHLARGKLAALGSLGSDTRRFE